jgi:RNase P/RNase MRP subunit POP5
LGGVKKQKPVRKLLRKSQRPKRRYILFSLETGSCRDARQAFGIVMGCFSPEEKRQFGTWFIGFNQGKSEGILRCHLDSLDGAKRALEGLSGAKVLKVSGTIKALGHR